MNVEITCLRCNYIWTPRNIPRSCPRCKSYNYNVPLKGRGIKAPEKVRDVKPESDKRDMVTNNSEDSMTYSEVEVV